jgi:hypothetical protein
MNHQHGWRVALMNASAMSAIVIHMGLQHRRCAMDWETIGFWDGASDEFQGPENSPLELASYIKGFREGGTYLRRKQPSHS